jgi:hypothetical protein
MIKGVIMKTQVLEDHQLKATKEMCRMCKPSTKQQRYQMQHDEN